MNRLEDLIITIDNHTIITEKYIDKLIDDHYDGIFTTIRVIDIKHKVLNFHQIYSFNTPTIIKYISNDQKFNIEYITKKNRKLLIDIDIDLSRLYIQHSETVYKNRYIGDDAMFLFATSKFCALCRSYTRDIVVLINDNNRFEMYSTNIPAPCYGTTTYITVIINTIKKLCKSYIDPFQAFRIENTKDHKRSNIPHKQICISLIHKFDEYLLSDYNLIKCIMDYLYPYRY